MFSLFKVGSTHQEFDLNIVFKWNPNGCRIVKIGQDQMKKNFAPLLVTKSDLTASERKIIFTDRGVDYISPEKMFGLLKSSIDRVLTGLDLRFDYQGQTYRVTRHEYAPVTIVCSGPETFFEVDFVPSFKFDFRFETTTDSVHTELYDYYFRCRSLPDEISQRVDGITNQYNVSVQNANFMAISLHRADKEKFELDFHELEREILYNRGCLKKVIKLMKYLRDQKGGPILKLWSHLIKVVSLLNFIY